MLFLFHILFTYIIINDIIYLDKMFMLKVGIIKDGGKSEKEE